MSNDNIVTTCFYFQGELDHGSHSPALVSTVVPVGQ